MCSVYDLKKKGELVKSVPATHMGKDGFGASSKTGGKLTETVRQ